MAGNKNSGRRSHGLEARVDALADKAIAWAIEHWDELTNAERVSVVKTLAPRYVTEKKEITGSEGAPLTIRWASNA